MKRITTLALVLLSPALVQADGEELFEEFCISCHGDGSIVVEEFTGTRERFQQTLEGFTEDMPDFYGVFSEEEMDALYEYVTRDRAD